MLGQMVWRKPSAETGGAVSVQPDSGEVCYLPVSLHSTGRVQYFIASEAVGPEQRKALAPGRAGSGRVCSQQIEHQSLRHPFDL